MKWKNLLPRLGAGALVIAGLLTAALAAGQGSESDPLITLSYLEQQVKPAIMTQVDQKLASQSQALTEQFQKDAAALKKEVEDKLAQSGGQSSGFRTVSLSAGQVLTAQPGCELLLRTGSAKCSAPSSPGFVDLTSGGALENAAAFSPNHLYVSAADGSAISALDAVVLLVRGSYSLG